MNPDDLIRLFREVLLEQALQVEEAGDLLKDRNSERLIQSIHRALDDLGLQAEEVMIPSILEAYEDSLSFAGGQLAQATGQGATATAITSRIHAEAVEKITMDTMLDLQSAIRTAKHNSEIVIQSALADVRDQLGKSLIRGDARRAYQARVGEALMRQGFTSFVTSDGKELPLDFYASTVANTKIREAHVTASRNRYEEAGVNLVQINGNLDQCGICAQYNGMVVSLDGSDSRFPSDISLPPYHPNCRCAVYPYVIDMKSDEEIAEAMRINEQRGEGTDHRTEAQKRAYEKEQKQKRRENEEKKQYARYKAVFGEDAPKTLGAFRRMKRNGSETYQNLESEYRSISQRIRYMTNE